MKPQGQYPAFPQPLTEAGLNDLGMSLRDYVATHVFAGLAASGSWSDNFNNKNPELVINAADTAVICADALIERLKR